MDARHTIKSIITIIACTALATISPALAPSAAPGNIYATAYAAQMPSGQWLHTKDAKDNTFNKIALQVDKALNAQAPHAKVTVRTSKQAKEILVKVRAQGTSAGLGKAKAKTRCAHSSLVMKASASNMYKSPYNSKTVKTDTVIYGIDNYGSQTLTSKSVRVGKTGVAEIRIRYQAAVWTYRGNSFTKASQLREVYWNQSKSFKVASVKIPKSYRLVLKLERK